jgi:hypothetical protein
MLPSGVERARVVVTFPGMLLGLDLHQRTQRLSMRDMVLTPGRNRSNPELQEHGRVRLGCAVHRVIEMAEKGSVLFFDRRIHDD